MKRDRDRRQAHQLAADQASRRVRRDGDADAAAGRGPLVASGRTMDEIAAGKGRAPKPFMLTDRRATADAVWDQPGRRRACGRQASRAAAPEGQRRSQRREDRGHAGLHRAAAVQARRAAAAGRRLGARDQVRRLSHAAARRGRHRRRSTRKGLDWTDKFAADRRRRGEACPTASSTARSWRSTRTARRISRRCRRRSPTATADDLVFFAFDLLFADGEDLRQLPLRERKERLQKLLDVAATARDQPDPLRRALRRGRRRRAAIGLPHVRWKASSPSSSTRRTGPAAAATWTKAKCRAGHEVVIGGWTDDRRAVPLAARRRLPRTTTSSMSAASAPASAATSRSALLPRAQAARERRPVPFTGAWRAAQGRRHALGQARAGRRDRVRRLDRRRPCAAGRLQGAARGQAGARSRGRDAGAAGRTGDRPNRRRAAKRASRAATGKAERRHGRADLQSRQAAVAGRRTTASRSPSWTSRATTRRSATG